MLGLLKVFAILDAVETATPRHTYCPVPSVGAARVQCSAQRCAPTAQTRKSHERPLLATEAPRHVDRRHYCPHTCDVVIRCNRSQVSRDWSFTQLLCHAPVKTGNLLGGTVKDDPRYQNRENLK